MAQTSVTPAPLAPTAPRARPAPTAPPGGAAPAPGGAAPADPAASGGIPIPTDVSQQSRAWTPEDLNSPGCLGEGTCTNCNAEKPYRFWGRSEYILWRVKDTSVPEFNSSFSGGFLFVPVTTSVGTVTVSTTATGATTTSGSSVVPFTATPTIPATFSNTTSQGGTNNTNFGDQPGLRFTLGYWFDQEGTFGMDANFFRLWRRTNTFFDVNNSSNNSIPTGFNAVFSLSQVVTANGTVGSTVSPTTTPITTVTSPIFLATTTTANLAGQLSSETWGAEVNARCEVCSFGCLRIDAVGGLRYFDLDERLSTVENINLNGVPSVTITPPAGTTNALPSAITLPATSAFNGTIADLIDVHNRFYGAQAGFDYDWRVAGGVFISGFTKIAIGDMRDTFSLRGLTQQVIPSGSAVVPPGLATTAGGQFVGPDDNNTTRHYDRVCFMPEFDINLGYYITDNIRVFVGYDYLYISALARPADQLTQAAGSSALAIATGGREFLGLDHLGQLCEPGLQGRIRSSRGCTVSIWVSTSAIERRSFASAPHTPPSAPGGRPFGDEGTGRRGLCAFPDRIPRHFRITTLLPGVLILEEGSFHVGASARSGGVARPLRPCGRRCQRTLAPAGNNRFLLLLLAGAGRPGRGAGVPGPNGPCSAAGGAASRSPDLRGAGACLSFAGPAGRAHAAGRACAGGQRVTGAGAFGADRHSGARSQHGHRELLEPFGPGRDAARRRREPRPGARSRLDAGFAARVRLAGERSVRGKRTGSGPGIGQGDHDSTVSGLHGKDAVSGGVHPRRGKTAGINPAAHLLLFSARSERLGPFHYCVFGGTDNSLAVCTPAAACGRMPRSR